jgi:hypothetical protein
MSSSSRSRWKRRREMMPSGEDRSGARQMEREDIRVWARGLPYASAAIGCIMVLAAT